MWIRHRPRPEHARIGRRHRGGASDRKAKAMFYEAMGWLHARLLTVGADRERGQGTVEYVGLVLLLAVILAAVIAAAKSTGGLKDIPVAIVAKLKEAIGSMKVGK